jgi:type VI secretion system secreted protein Hcp
MAVDMFLKMKDFDGEATDHKHKGSIDVLAWSWGVSQSGTGHQGGGSGAGKASFQNIQITKYVDKSSNKLMRACTQGEHIPEAILTVRKAGTDQQEYIKWTFNECLISSVSTGGSGGEDRLTESLSLNYVKVKFEYWPQKPDGTLDGVQPYSYDIKAQKKF